VTTLTQTSTLQAVAANTPITSLRDRAMLCSCQIRLWRGIKSDKRASAVAAQHYGANPEMFNASRHLIAEDVIRRLEARRAHYRAEWARRTLPWLDDGTRIVTGAGIIPLKQAISGFQDEWAALVDEFVAQYPYLREDARRSLGTAFNINDYPDPNRVRERFSFTFTAFPLPDLSDWRADGVTQAQLDEIRAQTEQSVRATFDAAQAEAWASLREPIAKMAETLLNYTGGRKGSFHPTLVTNLVRALDLLPSLNLKGDPTLDQITAIASQLTIHSADELRRDKIARADTAELASQLIEQIDQFI
jgi:hypothetical protein